jgi:LysR family transcriptional regulator, glycine cleavage system transcriptional activator
MARRLPPIQTLRAFEAAARTLSFTKAAEEIFVTASAVSQQVRHLEDQLGVKLFRRLVTGLALTDEGRTLLPHVRRGFEALSEGLDSLADPNLPRTLKLLVLSSFATKWLVPRLGGFADLYPAVEISLFHHHEPPDFGSTDFDLAILWGDGEWKGCDCYFLMEELIFPVCSQKLLDGAVERGRPESLAGTVILRTALFSQWPLWLKGANIDRTEPMRTRVFDDGSMMIDAAVEGQGVALARSVLAADAIAAGKLVVPFRPITESPYSYYMVVPDDRPISPTAQAFMDWIASQARSCSHNRLKAQLQALDAAEEQIGV